MADHDGLASGGFTGFDFNAVFRVDIAEILAEVDTKLASEVVDEMIEMYDMPWHLNTMGLGGGREESLFFWRKSISWFSKVCDIIHDRA